MMDLYNFDFSKKIFYHPEKIVEYKEGKRPFPITIEIDLTNRCNHRCSFCFYAEHIAVDKSSQDTNTILNILKEAKELGTKGVSFTGGGEPMVHKDFVQILTYANSIGLDCGLITNGSAIRPQNIEALINNLKWIRISMGGGDIESYKKVQGIDHFEKVISNVDELARSNDRSEKKINIGVRVLVTEENVNSLVGLSKKLETIKINYVQFAPDMFTKDDGAFWNALETQNIFAEVKDNLNRYGTLLLTAGYLKEQPRLDYPCTCYAHFFQVAITAEGDVTFCKNARGEEKFAIGNINNHSLKEIWGGIKSKQIEGWVKPSNCGLFCKNMQLNVAMEDVLNPTEDMSPNFIS